jgi:hypothetical protein
MKKLLLGLSVFTFLLFLTVDKTTASTVAIDNSYKVENVSFDKDPTADGGKKCCSKEAKADKKNCCSKESKADCSKKEAKANCSKSKTDCSKKCASHEAKACNKQKTPDSK